MDHDYPTGGWYPNPDGSPNMAYWNGLAWIEPTPPPKKTPWLKITAGVAGGLVVLGLIVGLASRSPDTETVTATKTSAAPTPTTTSPTQTPRQQLRAWGQFASPVLFNISDDLDAVGLAAKAEDFPGTRAACHKLGGSLTALDNLLPAPDVELTRELNAVVNDYSQVADICVTVDTSTTDSEFNRIKTLLDSGNTHMEAALAITKRILGN